jgi:hypothetical protein
VRHDAIPDITRNDLAQEEDARGMVVRARNDGVVPARRMTGPLCFAGAFRLNYCPDRQT